MALEQTPYVRGKKATAATSLVEHLRQEGISATVGYNTKKRERVLIAFVDADCMAKVPREWGSFEVRVESAKALSAAIEKTLASP